MSSRTLLPRTLRPLSLHASPAISVQRTYHSYNHPPPPSPFSALESRILSSALPHIPTHGFTTTSLALGAKEHGYIDASTNLFPRGAFSLVHFYLVTKRLGLKEQVKEVCEVPEGKREMGIGAKVRELAWARLEGNREVVVRWQEALALMAQPSHAPTALHELASLSDEIWFLAGDVSVDTSWYTKRATLSAVYAASELFMTTDKSEGFRDTREFLERRLGDVRSVGGTVGSVGQWLGFTASAGLNVLRSKGVRI